MPRLSGLLFAIISSPMKFSIRDLFLVTLIAAVCVAWAIDHRRHTREVKELKEQVEKKWLIETTTW